MDVDLAGELERFIERDAIWDAAELDRCAAVLAARGGDVVAGDLAHVFAALRVRLDMGPVSPHLSRDVEAVLYPMLWKVIEAVRDDLPAGEQLTRSQVLKRRLARLFVSDDPRGS